MSDPNQPAEGDPFAPPPEGAAAQVPGIPNDPPAYGTPATPPPPPPPPLPVYGSTPPLTGYNSPASQPYPPAAGYGVPKSSGKAVAVMVLGIVGLVLLCGYGIGIVPAIVSLALAPGAKREIAASGGALTGEGMVKAGVVCSWIAVGLSIAIIGFIIIAFAIGAAGSAASVGG
ncbi:hypothetical protein [Longivirga aurantiaca]|uniref:DUF4190 domain-containing protein n=1 Tax=Longivirga aurantiaca TaxID=1837743 RepID=A0ABW1T098_9ACTN